jgi:UDP-glucuronate decarboxylase
MNFIVEQDLKAITSADLPWDAFNGKTVLVTGAGGMLGAYMVESLLYLNTTRGYNISVIALVRDRKAAELRFAAYDGRSDLRITAQDICYPLMIRGKVDYIVHTASLASRPYYETDPVGTLAPNVLGTYYLLDLARQKGAQMLYFSTDVAILDLKPTDSWACYAIGKKMGEVICDAFWSQYKVPSRIVRLSHSYGPGMRLDEERVFCAFTKAILTDGILKIYGNGENTKPFCYISDAITGVYTVLLKGEVNHPYGIGADNVVTINQLAERLVDLFPEKHLQVVHTDTEYLMKHHWPLDIREVGALGWKPTTSIEDGFRKTVAYYETR